MIAASAATREVASTAPWLSTISPRGAAIGIDRSTLAVASATFCGPVSTCRYQRRKPMIPNSTNASTPSTPTRRVSWGGSGARRCSGGSITGARAG